MHNRQIQSRVRQLADRDRRDRTPGRHRRMLPARLIGCCSGPAYASAADNYVVRTARSDHVLGGAGDAEMVLGLPPSSVILEAIEATNAMRERISRPQ
jgi:hypothetical protein